MAEKKLVIGGSYQGKLQFVLEQFGYTEDQVVTPDHFMGSELRQKAVLYGFHEMMRMWLQEGKDGNELVDLLMKEEQLEVIISDEVGRGIVPLEKEERYAREQIGRALCRIAGFAAQVYRIHCGIAMKIKG